MNGPYFKKFTLTKVLLRINKMLRTNERREERDNCKKRAEL